MDSSSHTGEVELDMGDPQQPHETDGKQATITRTSAPEKDIGPLKITRVDLRARGRDRLRDMGIHKITASCQQAVNIIRELYGSCGWLDRPDFGNVRRLAEREVLFVRMSERLAGRDLETVKGEPVKLLSEWRQLADSLDRAAERLGLSAASRFNMGVDIGRGMDLAQQLQALRKGES